MTKPTLATSTAKAKPEETKRQRFERLGGARMGKALKAIEGLGNLSGAAYEYSPADVTKMRTAISEAMETALRRFDPTQKAAPKTSFKF